MRLLLCAFACVCATACANEAARPLSKPHIKQRSSLGGLHAERSGAALPLGIQMPQARSVQLYLLFASRLVQSILRMAMGPLVVYVCDEMAGKASDKALLLSAFPLGYLSTQIAGGVLGDKIGSKAVILLATLLASAFTFASGVVSSVRGLWLMQLLMGASQGPLFPTSIAYLAPWLPPEERARASTMLDTGITVGSLVALPFSGALAIHLGWRGTLFLYASLALAFAAAWLALAEPRPEQCSYISAAELAYLRQTVRGPAPRASAGHEASAAASRPALPAQRLLTHPAVCSIFLSHMAFNFGTYFITSWSPSFYQDALGMRPERVTLALSMPPALNCAVKALVNKPLEAWLASRCGLSTLGRRRFFTCVGFGGTAAALLLLPAAAAAFGAAGSAFCFSVALGFAALHPSGFKANYMDVTSSSGGLVSGVGNTLASIASFAAAAIIGRLLSAYGSWALVLSLIALGNLVATLAFASLSVAAAID